MFYVQANSATIQFSADLWDVSRLIKSNAKRMQSSISTCHLSLSGLDHRRNLEIQQQWPPQLFKPKNFISLSLCLRIFSPSLTFDKSFLLSLYLATPTELITLLSPFLFGPSNENQRDVASGNVRVSGWSSKAKLPKTSLLISISAR